MLQVAPLMRAVDEHLLHQVARSGRLRTFTGRHGRIDREELSTHLFFILSGEMRMLRMTPDGQEHLLQRFKPGEFFCLASIVSGHACNSMMINAGKTELIYWDHKIFRRFMRDDAEFHDNVLGQMAFQIEQEREMRTLSRCCKIDVRVAAFLLHKMKPGPCLCQCLGAVDIRPVGLTAQELGMARETLSRSLQRLVRRRAITYQRGLIRVADLTTLEEVLEEEECACACQCDGL